MRPLLIFSWLVIFTNGCYFDVESELYPETNCTPVTIATYSADVVPILEMYCNSCHTGSFASGGVRLDSYSFVKIYVDNNGLMGSITWSSGYSPMPKDAGKLSACNIEKINAWIAAGALNN